MNTFLRFIVVIGASLVATVTYAQQTTWEAAYRGDDPKLLYLPDTEATYWRYGWTREPGDKSGIIIKGQMPDARYFSYNVYDDEIKSSLGSITDFKIKPDNGASNPFLGKGGDAHAKYTILVLPEGTKTDAKNVLYFPDSLTKISVFLRHYVAKDHFLGNVPLPTIENYDPENNKTSVAPPSDVVPVISKQEAKKYLVPMLKRMISEFEKDPNAVVAQLKSSRKGGAVNMKELIASQVVAKSFKLFKSADKQYSLRLQTTGTYPNDDNYYLGLPIIRDNNQGLLVRFKAPKRPMSTADYPDASVRYFSLSQGDMYSYTHGTIPDTDMKLDDEGFANFIIADDTPEMAVKAKELGVNFMPWLAGKRMLLIYRHMLPAADFAYGIDKIAIFDPKLPERDQLAVKTIGAYAMVGKLMPESSIASLKSFPKF